MTEWPFGDFKRGHYGVVYADPPWHWKSWADVADTPAKATTANARDTRKHYELMEDSDLRALPVADLAAENSVLFLWIIWPHMPLALDVITSWGFTYKTCAFAWVKADNTQPSFFVEELSADLLLGFWTRANSEVCLLATRGKPKRLNADVRQAIIAPRRQHSRKPDGIHERIERLVAGPYVELFARQSIRPGWDFWGNQTDKFNER